jgi:hypothetical protein
LFFTLDPFSAMHLNPQHPSPQPDPHWADPPQFGLLLFGLL